MNKQKIFISSVQTEFSAERQMLNDYISTDALLGRFFEPFIFENLPASDRDTGKAYLEQVTHSDIYLGIFGTQYGLEDAKGKSPTEKEFEYACNESKTRLVFVCRVDNRQRHPKMLELIRKAEGEVVRKKFSSPSELKTAVYAALVSYLEEKEFIRTVPFDATIYRGVSINDIDPERVRWFVETARAKRNFPISVSADPEEVLTHLNILRAEGLTNSAILLFGKQPQRHFITAEIRCVLFHGNEVSKPIPSYQVYKGDVFQQVNLAVDFVLSRINLFVGDRSKSVDVPTEYELPPAAVKEAIVNAVAHRDYTSNASVQVMLFRNRLEVWNPGHLPYHLPVSKLKKPHGSFPRNPLLAEPMYLAGFIERMGTGIPDLIKACIDAGLKEPDLIQEESFKIILWRKESTEQVTPHDTPHDAPYDTDQVPTKYRPSTDELPQEFRSTSVEVRNLVTVMEGELNRLEIQELLELKHEGNFRDNYLVPALDEGILEMKYPQKNHPKQKYRLTAKGKALQQQLKNKQ